MTHSRSQPNIVDRLRNFCVWNNRQSHYEPVPLTSEAADEIDRLRAELASARKALEEIIATHVGYGVSPVGSALMHDIARAALGQPK